MAARIHPMEEEVEKGSVFICDVGSVGETKNQEFFRGDRKRSRAVTIPETNMERKKTHPEAASCRVPLMP